MEKYPSRRLHSVLVVANWLSEHLQAPSARRFATATVATIGLAALASSNAQAGEDCASFRDEKDGMFLGLACKSQGDTFYPVGKQQFADRPYGVIRIAADGSYKCGYLDDEVIPRPDKENSEASITCVDDQDLIDNRRGIYSRINCPEDKSNPKNKGDNTCNGPTFFTGIEEHCQGTKRRVYRNFTPVGKNILNATGINAEHPFTGIVTSNKDVSYVQFRTKIAYKSSNGIISAVVRSDDTNKRLGWGHFRYNCLDKTQLDGGPPDKD